MRTVDLVRSALAGAPEENCSLLLKELLGKLGEVVAIRTMAVKYRIQGEDLLRTPFLLFYLTLYLFIISLYLTFNNHDHHNQKIMLQ